MATRIPWDQYEIALLFDSYERIVAGETIKTVASELSETLRKKAIAEGKQIDTTFRNVNGMLMQLGNVQYLMTDGKRGLSGASSSIKQAYRLMRDNPEAFAIIREEAKQMVSPENNTLCAFMEYLKERHSYLKEEQICSLFKRAEEYCHLKSPLLGNLDIKEVREIQQKIASGGALRYKYGSEETKHIQDAVNAYYCFIKTYRKTKATVTTVVPNCETEVEEVGKPEPCPPVQSEWLVSQLKQKGLEYIDYRQKSGCLWIVGGSDLNDFSREALKHGYKLIYKDDGCRAFPGKKVWWTKDTPAPQQRPDIYDTTITKKSSVEVIDTFAAWLKSNKKLADRSIYLYIRSIKNAEQYIIEHHLDLNLINATSATAASTCETLMANCDFCGYGLSNYRAAFSNYIAFLSESTSEADRTPNENDCSTHSQEEHTISNELMTELTSVVADCFPRGIRPGSIIDRKKLQRAYSEKYGKELDTTIDLQTILPKLGITIGEFVKVLPAEKKIEIINLINGIVADGMGNVFYSELFKKHVTLWEDVHIEDSEMLVKLLRSLMPEYHYTESYLFATGATYESDLLNAYGDSLVLSCEEVHERLPYMDMPTIKLTLSRLHSFVWSSVGVFARTDRVRLAEADIDYVEKVAIPEMNLKGYYGLNQLPLQASCELNPELSFYAIRDAMYWRHMAGQADRMRVIATPKGKTISSYELIQKWCKEQDQTTNDELAEIERDITGSFHNLSGYCACYNMIRIDQNEYINDRFVTFDVTAIDNAISLFVQNRLTSLTSITSFTSFPDLPGYTWNLYLVESFLRRFSKRFSIDGGPAQTSYVGCIAPKNQAYGCYEDRLAAAVVQDNVHIDENSIGDYLIAKKYVLRRTSSQIKTICSKAIKLQEQRSVNGV